MSAAAEGGMGTAVEMAGEGRVFEYARLTGAELAALDRQKTIFLWAVSPLEVHGPHLPVGTDVLVALELQRRCLRELSRRRPDLTFVLLPPLYAGADPLPVQGSVGVPAPVLEELLLAYAAGLAGQGFRYLLVTDNHGGPRHQMAIEAAARRAWRRHRFYLLDPFGRFYRRMVLRDPALLQETGLGPGRCGDDADSHAGTNETSLVLAFAPELVSPGYRELPPALPPRPRGGARLLSRLAGWVRRLGCSSLAGDLEHLAATLAWVGDPEMKPYLGAPALSSPQAGERMLEAHVRTAVELVERALRQEPVRIRPLLW
ncbi:MAG: creatininase family protein, partial [Bacillota bacterium]|nr:creatininase family protein [Bacillota bacterium]